ncbi:MAG: addiction module protein [Nostocoides sp.]
MVSMDLLASVAALSEDERVELVGYIEQTLDTPVAPTAEQQVLVERRVAELKADPGLGLTKDEAIAAARALLV